MDELIVTKIVAANRLYNSETEQPIQRRNRPRWAVALKRTGRTIYTVDGHQLLSDIHHPVILPKGSCYSWRCEEPGECLLIEFDAPQERGDILSFTIPDAGFFENTFLEIQKNLHIPSAEARMTCFHKLYGLLLHLMKTTQKDYAAKGRQMLLQPAMDYVSEKYFDPDITNERLAGMCGISTVYFRKSFEAAYGVPPIRFLHDLRIQKAKDILSSDYGSIAQVAESVGYSSVYHFSKMFKTYTGISPTQYAKRTGR